MTVTLETKNHFEGLDLGLVQRFHSLVARELAKISQRKISYLAEEGNNNERISLEELDVNEILSSLIHEGRDIDFDSCFSRFPDLLNVFFNDEVIKHLDKNGAQQLATLAFKCAACPNYADNIQLRIGIGVHDGDNHSVRLPSYIYPAVNMVQGLADYYAREGRDVTGEMLPSVVIYSAANMVSQVNTLNGEMAYGNTSYYFEVFRRFVEDKFSDERVRSRFSFLRDKVEVDAEVERVLMNIAREIAATRREVSVVSKICDTANRHGSDELMGLYYGSSHAVYSLDSIEGIEGKSLVQGEDLDVFNKDIVMIGGKSEVDYWRLRQLVKKPHSGKNRGQIIQKYSEIPPYNAAIIAQDLSTVDVKSMRTVDDFRARLKQIRSGFRKDIELICDSTRNPVEYFKYIFEI